VGFAYETFEALCTTMLDLSTMNWNSEVPTFCNTTTKQYLLKMDEACFTFHNMNNKYTTQELEIWGQSSKCQEVGFVNHTIASCVVANEVLF
jgi:hypothetical protein